MNWKQINNFNNSPVVVGAFALIFIFALILAIGVGLYWTDSENPPSSPDKKVVINSPLPVGGVGMLNNNKDKKDCSGVVLMTPSKEAFDELTKVGISGDEYGLTDLILQGKVTSVANCTK